MRKYIEQLLIKDIKIDESLLSASLFISFDDASALRKDYLNVLKLIKCYSKYEVVKENVRILQEGYEQGHYIIKLEDKEIFIRIILSNKELYDCLIYTIKDIDFINRVFFSRKELEVPNEFKEYLKLSNPVICLYKDNNDYRIVKANKSFYSLIKYEDWDFANKYQSVLNQIAKNNQIDLNDLWLYKSDKELFNAKTKYYNLDNYYIVIIE